MNGPTRPPRAPVVAPRAVTPVFGWHLPVHADPANVPYDLTELAGDIEASLVTHGITICTSAADRDAKIPAPVKGQRCHRTDLNRDQIYSGTGWRDDYNLVPNASQRVGIGSWTGTFTLDASGVTQAIDLSQAGVFTGALIWASGFHSSLGVQLRANVNTISAARFMVYNQAGTVQASASLTNMNLTYAAPLAY